MLNISMAHCALLPVSLPIAADHRPDWHGPVGARVGVGHTYARLRHIFTERFEATDCAATRNPLVPRPRAEHG